MMINLELYRVFYIVAKNGSLTKAKEELFISQPAVSQAIKQLEIQLGGKLFIRTSKGMELTGEGKVMYEYVKQACNLISIAEHKFSQMNQKSKMYSAHRAEGLQQKWCPCPPPASSLPSGTCCKSRRCYPNRIHR